MKTFLNPTWLEDLVKECRFLDAYSKGNPHSSEFAKDLTYHVDQAGRNLWGLLSAEFRGESEETILRNTWAIASSSPILAGAVWRAAYLQLEPTDPLLTELYKFKSSILKRGNFPAWLEPLIEPTFDTALDLSGVQEFTPPIRFRFLLAALTKKRFNSLECIESIRQEKRCSRLARQHEIKKALDSAGKKSTAIQRIPQKVFLNLPLLEKMVIATDDQLIQTMVDSDGYSTVVLKKLIIQAWKERSELRGKLIEIRQGSSSWNRGTKRRQLLPINQRHIDFINDRSEYLNLDAVDDDLRAEFGNRFEKWLALPKDPSSNWTPLSQSSANLLRKISPNTKLPRYLRLDAAEITRRIVAGNLSKNIRADDIAQVRNSWTDKDREELAYTGRIAILDKLNLDVAATIFPQIVKAADSLTPSIALNCLADLVKQERCIAEAISLLERDKCRQLRQRIREAMDKGSNAWASALYPFFGTETAATFFNDPSKKTIRALLSYFLNGSGIKDYNRYKHELARVIGVGLRKTDDKELAQWTKMATNFISDTEGATAILADYLGLKAVITLLKQSSASSPLSKALEANLSDVDTLKEINQYRIAHAGSAANLFNILHINPTLIELLRPRLADDFELDKSIKGLAALVLCFRRSPERLKSMEKEIGPGRFRSAVAEGGKLLPLTSRDRGYLELAASLGARNIRTLAAVMASMDRSAPAGHKLDKSYHRYELPKKSGGSRTVSVPAPILKKVQKAILLRIVDGFGAHPAAHGFVKGRSIVSNAALHVDCPVVSNCDIANCFPSVKWSLVLGALRRDCGKTFCQAAVSLIVDICTMQGGLPIGAPTSPALLNRVLLKTDKILSAAASKRQCHYSRYADDMTFSGDDNAVALLGVAKRTISQIGLSLDSKKTNIYRRGRRQIVTGLVVNDRVSVPRRLRRRMRAAIHAVEQGKAPTWHGQVEPLTSLRGRIAYLHSVNREEGERLLSRLKSIGDGSDV